MSTLHLLLDMNYYHQYVLNHIFNYICIYNKPKMTYSRDSSDADERITDSASQRLFGDIKVC